MLEICFKIHLCSGLPNLRLFIAMAAEQAIERINRSFSAFIDHLKTTLLR
jgi:hypothetical protein